MSENANSSKTYNLEERTFLFAHSVRTFIKTLPKTIGNIEDSSQLVRSSGSVGANYIEANESVGGQKEFLYRIKISRKEAKESGYWLRLIDTNNNQEIENNRQKLIAESTELMLIFAAILRKSQ